jgi:hypothetical protein
MSYRKNHSVVAEKKLLGTATDGLTPFPKRSGLMLGLLLVPGFLFTTCLLRFGVDAPYIDDFHLYNFVYRFDQTGDPSWFLTQTNEHRTAFARLLVWATERLTGRVNLVWQMLVSTLVLSGLTLMLARAFRPIGLGWGWFLPVPFLVFQTQGWSNYYWGFCAISNVAVIGFVVWSLYWVRARGWRFWVAILLGAVATFTMGSGMMVFAAGTPALVAQRRWQVLGRWLAGAGASAGLYLYHFKSPGDWLHPTPVRAAVNWVTYLGNFADFTDQSSGAFKPVCFTVGLGLVGLAGWGLWRETFSNDRRLTRPTFLFLLGLLTYVAGTAALVALNRVSMIENRYKLNAVLFLVATYLLVVPGAKRLPFQRVAWVIPLTAAVLFFGYTYLRYLPDIMNFRQEVLSNLFSRRNGGTSSGDPFLARLRYLEQKGAYRLPAAYERTFGPLNRLPPFPATRLNDVFPGLVLTADSTKITLSDAVSTWSNDPDEGLWLVLQGDSARFAWRAARRGAGVGAFLQRGRLLQRGARADLYAAWVRPGQYRVLVYRSGAAPRLVATNLHLEGRAQPLFDWLD